MSSTSDNAIVLRFEDFELDVETGDLTRRGERLTLQPQPARVLAFLARHPGTVVSRESLVQHLWGVSGTHVRFDQALNFAVRQIRVALQDSGHQPRVIQTLPRRGYRFLAPVSVSSRRPSTAVSPRWWATETDRRHPTQRLLLALAAGMLVAASLGGLLPGGPQRQLDARPGNPAHHQAAVRVLRGIHDVVFDPTTGAGSAHHRIAVTLLTAAHDSFFKR